MDKLYGGIDLHANNSVVVVLNDQDQVVTQKMIPNELPTILAHLAPFQSQLQGLAVESTYKIKKLAGGNHGLRTMHTGQASIFRGVFCTGSITATETRIREMPFDMHRRHRRRNQKW